MRNLSRRSSKDIHFPAVRETKNFVADVPRKLLANFSLWYNIPHHIARFCTGTSLQGIVFFTNESFSLYIDIKIEHNEELEMRRKICRTV